MLVSQRRLNAPQMQAFGSKKTEKTATTEVAKIVDAAETSTPKAPKSPLRQKLANASRFVYKKGLTPIGHGLITTGKVLKAIGKVALKDAIPSIAVGMVATTAVALPFINSRNENVIKDRTSIEGFKNIKENAALIADKNCFVTSPLEACIDKTLLNIRKAKVVNPYLDYLKLTADSLKRNDSIAMGFSVSEEGPKPNTEFNVPALRAEDSAKKALVRADANAEHLRVRLLHSVDSAKAKIDLRVDSAKAAARHIR